MNRPRGKLLALSTAALALAVLIAAAWLSWPQVRFWWCFESMGLNAQGYPEYRHRQTGIVMVRVPGGTFWMGAQKEDPSGQNYDPDALENEGPVHEVRLSPFLIAKYETSQAEWDRVVGSNLSHFKGADLPVECVSWQDCQEFCRRTWLRLPTEAQWECACRAGSRAAFAFGETITLQQANYGHTAEPGNYLHIEFLYGDDPPDPSHRKVPAKSFEPNRFGLHQMHGNVLEWCQDAYDEKFYAKSEAVDKDPASGLGYKNRVARGGCWFGLDLGCRSAYRDNFVEAERGDGLGFRAAYYPLP